MSNITDIDSFIKELEKDYNMTVAELEGYYNEAKRLGLIKDENRGKNGKESNR